jgi:hypothetical protein
VITFPSPGFIVILPSELYFHQQADGLQNTKNSG